MFGHSSRLPTFLSASLNFLRSHPDNHDDAPCVATIMSLLSTLPDLMPDGPRYANILLGREAYGPGEGQVHAYDDVFSFSHVTS